MVQTCGGILLSLKKGGNPAEWDSMDELRGHGAKSVSHRRTNTAWFHLDEDSETVKFTEQRGCQGPGEMGSCCSTGVRSELSEMSQFLISAVQHCPYRYPYCSVHLEIC